ncbi:DNA gyrase inhibitor YacG [Manganibacter manganicus]|uniref:DNA gyrase inhibitor YacG n=1 Tax=Manganibacter manganicus TaxID=1873176 RepID=A0A1V8RL17_9HYPH|nr:DNA gyrase inhibitor YacG [Pseudaminobacter manganicus]OQM73639.1 DNA gyrase inhibitor YacG [Pseudaminobacter manganicus]
MSTDDKGSVTPLRPKRPCPECGRPSARQTYPFCSPRCKALDLNRWLKGAYAIPVREDEEDDETSSADKPVGPG